MVNDVSDCFNYKARFSFKIQLSGFSETYLCDYFFFKLKILLKN